MHCSKICANSIEEALQPFADDLREFLERVRAGQFGGEWRGAWQEFVYTQTAAGFNIEPDNASRLLQLMESWEEQRTQGALDARQPTHIAVQSGDHARHDSRSSARDVFDATGPTVEHTYYNAFGARRGSEPSFDLSSASQATSRDLSGSVKLNLTPDSPDSMDWYKWKAPSAGGKTGNTNTTHSGSWKKLSMKTGRGTIYKVQYRIGGTAQIWLDPAKIAKLENTPKGLSLEQSYGHEQFHVKNFISIMEAAKKGLEAFQDETYDSASAADAAAKKHLTDVLKAADKKIKTDKMHQTPGGPINGQGSDPIGTMPGDPIGTAK